jgi:hypothetical protein
MNSLTAYDFKNVDEQIQIWAAELLFKEWKDIFIESNVNSIEEVIIKMLEIHKCFVFLDDISKFLIGIVCINIDTPTVTFNTNYWISNLYIVERFRKKNIGAKVLAFIENYLYDNNVFVANLWCDKDVKCFYTKYNWNITQQVYPGRPESSIMIKMLSPIKNEIKYLS